MKDSFIIYTKYEEQISLLSDTQAGILLRALLCYQSGKTLPKMDAMTNIVFTVIRQQIDFDNQKYIDICEARRIAGSQGGRPSKSHTNKGNKPKKANAFEIEEEKPNDFSENQTKAKKAESESDTDTDNDTDNEERKKEIDKDYHVTTARMRVSADDFSKMTDEELIAWGERETTDFTDSDAIASFYAWNEEMEKRATNATKWSGKIIKSGGSMDRLKSHAEVMEDYGVENPLRETLQQFLRHCYANRHLVTNEKLGDIIFRLDEKFGDDEEAKCGCVSRAISGGYFDVKA